MLSALGRLGLAAILLLLVPFIPGPRDIPASSRYTA